MDTNSTLKAVIQAMGRFAANTTNDLHSVEVARTAARLQNLGRPHEKPLTPREQKMVNLFLRVVNKDAA